MGKEVEWSGVDWTNVRVRKEQEEGCRWKRDEAFHLQYFLTDPAILDYLAHDCQLLDSIQHNVTEGDNMKMSSNF